MGLDRDWNGSPVRQSLFIAFVSFVTRADRPVLTGRLLTELGVFLLRLGARDPRKHKDVIKNNRYRL